MDDASEKSDAMTISPDRSNGQQASASLKLLASTCQKGASFCFREMQLSPDGSCVLATDSARHLHTYALPNELDPLHPPDSPISLNPHSTYRFATPPRVFAPNPAFFLSSPETTTILISNPSQPLTLINAYYHPTTHTPFPTPLYDPRPPGVTNYRLIDPLTEQFITPSSILYTVTGQQFIAGSERLISIFDVDNTDGPVHQIKTTKQNPWGGGYGGIVSTLDICDSSGILAAGTLSRSLGLYEDEGNGAPITDFVLPGEFAGASASAMSMNINDEQTVAGTGITQIRFDETGNYLYIAERKSSVLHVYDIRNMHLGLTICMNRKAETNQKIGFDVWEGDIWSGGTDGCVRVWEKPYLKQGVVVPETVFELGGGCPVAGVRVHPDGEWLITAEGKMEVGGAKKPPGDLWKPEGTMKRLWDSDSDNEDKSSSEEEDSSEAEETEEDGRRSIEVRDKGHDPRAEEEKSQSDRKLPSRQRYPYPRIQEEGYIKIWQMPR